MRASGQFLWMTKAPNADVHPCQYGFTAWARDGLFSSPLLRAREVEQQESEELHAFRAVIPTDDS